METEVTVALIAAGFAYLGFVLTKEAKVSEFRHQWIELLRNDLSQLLSKATEFQLLFSIFCEGKGQANIYSKFIQEHSANSHEILMLVERVKFRLNPAKDSELLELLTELGEIISNPKNLKSDSLESVSKRLSKISHSLFKTEWERVKKGEPWFYWSKWIVAGVFVFILLMQLY